MIPSRLFVIAGPNGAGKSTFSHQLVQSQDVIDADIELMKRRKRYPDISSANLLEAMAEHWFPSLIAEALENNKDFAFETNFRNASVMDTVTLFQNKGYQTHLFFIGLPSLYESMERVMLRVQKGGHDVSNDDIAHNYSAGLANLKKYAGNFDRTIIFDNYSCEGKISQPKIVCKLEQGKLIEKATVMPKWAEIVLSAFF